MVLHYRTVAFGPVSQSKAVSGSPLEQGAIEGDSPVTLAELVQYVLLIPRVVLFESTAQNGW